MIEAPIPFDAIPILAALRKEDREALAPLCRLRGYEKGEAVFHEGDPAGQIHFVVRGRVKIVKAAGGRHVIIELLGPGEPVGAVAVFERKPFPASAVALEGSSILSIPEREFFTLLEKRPEMMRHLLAGLTLRLMMVNKRLADMTGSAEYRAARLFLTLADRVGHAASEGVFIPLALSRQEIADLIGTTVETAIRLMSRWQKDAIVLTEKNGFAVPDLRALQALTAE
ncbi:MAG TPA: Crp/Fnr family transcriptional regulator [Thermoanaerobaculia bacterium]|jgi:CRP-like cAMP-binding protein|nr:Crp/Fnr family transcriptional regulator [Thermoanaerobaculia bacterium]